MTLYEGVVYAWCPHGRAIGSSVHDELRDEHEFCDECADEWDHPTGGD